MKKISLFLTVIFFVFSGVVSAFDCYVDTSCSSDNTYSAMSCSTEECKPLMYCDNLYKNANLCTDSPSSTIENCVFSPGCSEGVQTCSSGSCTSISSCNDIISRTSECIDMGSNNDSGLIFKYEMDEMPVENGWSIVNAPVGTTYESQAVTLGDGFLNIADNHSYGGSVVHYKKTWDILPGYMYYAEFDIKAKSCSSRVGMIFGINVNDYHMLYTIYPNKIEPFYEEESKTIYVDPYLFDTTTQINTYKVLIKDGIAKLYINNELVIETQAGKGNYYSESSCLTFGAGSSEATAEADFYGIRAYKISENECFTQDDLDIAKEDARTACKKNPTSCGIDVSDDYNNGYEDGKATCKEGPCAQVITYGKAPNLDCWIMFPTPCDVPEGWETANEEPENLCGEGECDNLEDNLDISIPCIDVFGNNFPIYLEKTINKEDPFGFYWKLNLE